MIREYTSITEVNGPLLVVENVKGVSFAETVEVRDSRGKKKLGQVLELDRDKAVIQLFRGTHGIDTSRTRVRFTGQTMKIGVSESMLGRVFNALGDPLDDYPAYMPEKKVDINGQPMNPYRRDHPESFIQTGISSVDLMNTLVRGQKLPIFSGSGLPHNALAAQIARQASTLDEKFAVIFAAMGITFEEAMFFRNDLSESGNFPRSVMFLNLAKDPAIERIIMPRVALSVAEFLAFEKEMHVLVIMTDMTNYCEALREISASRSEVPGRRGYPGYMYTDLSTIYERAGRVKGRKGSITQIPILTMPDDDITHPVPDLTGYITEGQLVLSREMGRKGIYPPIDVLPSLSRLMNKGIGKKQTREDHKSVSDQLYASYARGRENRDLVVVVGEESLDETEQEYLHFADSFESTIVSQSEEENRSIETSLEKSWSVLGKLEQNELKRLSPEFIKKYYNTSVQKTKDMISIDIDTNLEDADKEDKKRTAGDQEKTQAGR